MPRGIKVINCPFASLQPENMIQTRHFRFRQRKLACTSQDDQWRLAPIEPDTDIGKLAQQRPGFLQYKKRVVLVVATPNDGK